MDVRRASDGAMRGLAKLLVRIFFRRIEVEGLEHLPAAGPTVLVANHINGLVDALLLMATLPRFPRFLGKSTLFRILPLWPFLKLAGVVPVYRASDGQSTARNDGSFRTCRRLLAHGREVALFPEGISHDQSMLQPLKTGAARIALGATVDDQVPDVVIVPVGLSYDAKARFRSRALVQAGTGQRAARWADAYGRDPHQAVRDMTAEMATRLRAVSPTYRSWRQASRLRQIAAIADRPADAVAGVDVDLARLEATARTLADAEASGRRPQQFEALGRAFAEYERDLALLGLSDQQVSDGSHPGRRRLALAWSATRVAAALPAAVAGAVVHVLPYQIMKKVGTVPTNESIKATVKLLGCFVLFTVVYVVLGVVVGETWGSGAGLIAAAGAPVCGYATVRLVERVKRIGGVAAGARVVRQRRAVLATVLAHRAALVEAVEAVLTGDRRP
jgi:glycerol-3-phosphate O-acyltransferase / dihydroxyacetone phosphate acyltransferase